MFPINRKDQPIATTAQEGKQELHKINKFPKTNRK